MKIERLKNSKRNVVFGLINKAILLIFPFIIRSVIIRLLGAEYMGLGSLFTSILSVLNLAELGLGSAMVFCMYKPLASDDMDTIRAILNLYKKIYRVIGGAVLVLGLAVLPFVQYLIFSDGNVPSDINLQLLFAIYLVDTAVTYFVFPYSGCVLSALQRTDIESNISSAVYIVMYAAQIAALYIFRSFGGKSYYAYIILQPVFNTALCLVRALVVKKRYPQFYCAGKAEGALVKDISSRVKALFGHKLGTVMLYSVDSIIISVVLGLTELTAYNNYYLIHAGVLGVLQVCYNAVKAGVGNSIVTESKEKNLRDFKKLTFMNSCVVGLCTICLLMLYNRFMAFWMGVKPGDSLLYPNYTVIAICVYFYLNSMRWIVLTYKDAAGLWREDAVKPYVESAINLLLAIILINTPLGVLGVVIASIVAVGLVSGPWETVVLLKKYFGLDVKGIAKYYLTYLLYSAVSVGIAVGVYYLCTYVAPGYTVKEFIIRVAISALVPTAAYCLVYCRKWEFLSCIDSLKLRLKRR